MRFKRTNKITLYEQKPFGHPLVGTGVRLELA